VSDIFGCYTKIIYFVHNNNLLSMSLAANAVLTDAVYNETGFVDGGGSISVTAIYGVPPYTFAWSNGASSASITSLPPGTYELTLRDSAQGFKVESYTVNAQLGVALDVSNASAFNAVNGSIRTTVYGGSSPFTYGWSNLTTTKDQDRVSVGTYSLNVTDTNGLVGQAVCNVTQPAPTGLHQIATLRATDAIDVPIASYLYFGSRNVRMGFDEVKGVMVIQKYIDGAYVTKIEV
jgi:hypothetical protein